MGLQGSQDVGVINEAHPFPDTVCRLLGLAEGTVGQLVEQEIACNDLRARRRALQCD